VITQLVDSNQLQVLYAGYFDILGVVKNSARALAPTTISLDDVIKKAYSSFSHANDTPLFDNERVWEFRYKIQYEEPRVKVVEQDPLTICWKNIKKD
jgi:hypothetical protein